MELLFDLLFICNLFDFTNNTETEVKTTYLRNFDLCPIALSLTDKTLLKELLAKTKFNDVKAIWFPYSGAIWLIFNSSQF